ncbi:MAG: DUF4384 domain-containing protein [Gammaproteobacteria bacterium]
MNFSTSRNCLLSLAACALLTATPVAMADCASAAASTASLADREGAVKVFEEIHDGRDPRRRVEVEVSHPRMTICRDKLEFTVRSSHPGHVYVLQLGSDGETFNLVFPNDISNRGNRLAAGETLRVPGDLGFEITAMGPPGTDRVLVLVSDKPRSFSRLKRVDGGGIAAFDTDAAGRIALTRALKRVDCAQKDCQSAYGAALVEIEEIP